MRPAIYLPVLFAPFLASPWIQAQQFTPPTSDGALFSNDTAEAAITDPVALTVPIGSDLRLAIVKGSRITHKGERVTATLTEPMYVGGVLAIPQGTLVGGYVSSIVPQNKNARRSRLLNGDFTPPKAATICFDQITMSKDQIVPFQSQASFGQGEMKLSVYTSKHDRPGLKAQAKQQVHEAIHEPNKMQRFTEAAITSLPYHPEYIDQGTVYDAMLQQPLQLTAQPAGRFLASEHRSGSYLHLRLLTAMSSNNTSIGVPISAILTEPYFDPSEKLIYPEGLLVSGKITKTASAGWLKKQGALRFSFSSVQMPDNTTQPILAIVSGISANRVQNLSVDAEGGLNANTSRLRQVIAPFSLIGPSTGLADQSTVKTAWARQGDGRRGFGFVGAGLAQSSAGTAIGLGYLGAARKLYEAFVAKGEDVILPAGTSIVLRVAKPEAPAEISSFSGSPTR